MLALARATRAHSHLSACLLGQLECDKGDDVGSSVREKQEHLLPSALGSSEHDLRAGTWLNAGPWVISVLVPRSLSGGVDQADTGGADIDLEHPLSRPSTWTAVPTAESTERE